MHLQKFGRFYALAACGFFFTAAQLFIPLFPIEQDEALFAAPLLPPRWSSYSILIRYRRIPLMLMTYMGTLKSWLYQPLFHLMTPSVWSTREPVIVAGVLSIWLFYLLLRRTVGERAAIFGAILLSTNSVYLLTTCFDWGPVVLQHLLIIGAVLLLVRFAQGGGSASMAGGFFLFGLALWDKAIAVWMISSIAIAAAIVFRAHVWKLFTLRRLAVAVLAFVLGALPLLIYNVNNDWPTFRSNAKIEPGNRMAKFILLRNTLSGYALYDYFADAESKGPGHQPEDIFQRASATLSGIAGHPHRNLTIFGFFLALALTPFADRNRLKAIVFCLLTFLMAFAEMLYVASGANGAHHTILLSPLPEAIMATSFAAASDRFGRAASRISIVALTLLVISNVLITNEYFYTIWRYGTPRVDFKMGWTDALFPLTSRMETLPANTVICTDWGIENSLRLMSNGQLPLQNAAGRLHDTWSQEDRIALLQMFASPGSLFVGHTEEVEYYHGNREKLLNFAESSGYKPQVVATVSDSFGRATFEILRFINTNK